MEITSEKVLDKMDELIQKAKMAPAEKRNGYLIAVQSLIDLVITDHTKAEVQTVKKIVPDNPIQQTNPTVLFLRRNQLRWRMQTGIHCLIFKRKGENGDENIYYYCSH